MLWEDLLLARLRLRIATGLPSGIQMKFQASFINNNYYFFQKNKQRENFLSSKMLGESS